MISQVVLVALGVLAVASAFPHHGHEEDYQVKYVEDHYDPHPRYMFSYGVHDSHTGDIKSQKEERDGDVVKGVYELVEPDGSKRVVKYTADHKTGFNAVVHREYNVHPQNYKKYEEPKYEYKPKYEEPKYEEPKFEYKPKYEETKYEYELEKY